MKKEDSKMQFKLVQISQNRYKIENFCGVFTRDHAKKIPGCYYSGVQKAWVFPISEQNRRIYHELTDQNKAVAVSQLKSEVMSDLEDFRRYLETNRYSKSTIQSYISILHKFFTFHIEKDPAEIEVKDIEMFNYHNIMKLKKSTSFQNQLISAIKKFYENRFHVKLYIGEIERPRKSEPLPKVLSQEDIQKLLSKVYNVKHRAILSLIYSAGLRRSEVLNLRITDVASNRMVLNIRNAKGKKDRIVGLSQKILELLKTYYRKHRPTKYLFEGSEGIKYSAGSVGNIFRRAKRRARITIPGGVHVLRHSFATHLHESGYDIRIIQEILGHKSSKTTEIYTHVSTKSIRNVKSPFENLNIKS
ncbi:MAG: tyrosine-type recombinase/integrase [Bacteroidales bacterium]|nr:tyrosine-type recombinase/integrase [Bacteroidales bacterium]